MQRPRSDVLLALEEALCARQDARMDAGGRGAESLNPQIPDMAAQIINIVESDRARTAAVIQKAVEQIEQLDTRLTRSEVRAREAEELLQHLFRCTEAHNEAKDMLKHLYRRIESQLTGQTTTSRQDSIGRSAA